MNPIDKTSESGFLNLNENNKEKIEKNSCLELFQLLSNLSNTYYVMMKAPWIAQKYHKYEIVEDRSSCIQKEIDIVYDKLVKNGCIKSKLEEYNSD